MVNFGDKENFDLELRLFASGKGGLVPQPMAVQPRAEAGPVTNRLAMPPAADPAPRASSSQATPPVTPPAEADPSARTPKESRSHLDLRQHIQAQLEFIRNSKSDTNHGDLGRLTPVPEAEAPLDHPAPTATGTDPDLDLHDATDPVEPADSAEPEAAQADEPPAGATVIEVRPPAFRAPAAAAASPQAPKPADDQPGPAGPDDVLERVSGNLAQLAAPGGILRRIIEEKQTGQLLLISEGETENQQELVYIQEGVMLGCSSLLHTPVRNLLLSAGLIRLEDIEEARQQTAAQGEGAAVETWLIRNGRVTREQVFETLGVAAREAVVGMMCREFGLFVWKRQQRASAPKALCKIPLREVALHYGRSLAAFEALQPELFNPGRIFKIHETFNMTHSQYRLLPHEWKFLFRVDGRRTLRQIREAVDIPVEDLNRHVFVCDLMGFIADCGLAKAEAAPESAGLAALRAAPSSAASAHKPPQAQSIDDRLKILIVDDSRTVQKMVLMALEGSNYHLRTADDGFEALQLIEHTPPDLVLLDVIMPRMDGYKVCSKIRKLLAPVKIPIIMLTARDGTFNNIRARLAGATTVINKPFDPAELRQTIGNYLAAR